MEDNFSKESLSAMRFVGEAGAGLVKVTVDGQGFPVKVEIDKSIFTETNEVLISDLFVAATRAGIEKADHEFQEMLKKAYLEKMKAYEKYLEQYEAGLDDGGGKFNN